jgi:hypothetical protein
MHFALSSGLKNFIHGVHNYAGINHPAIHHNSLHVNILHINSLVIPSPKKELLDGCITFLPPSNGGPSRTAPVAIARTPQSAP